MTAQNKSSPRYTSEVRERAVRQVLDHAGEYPSQWAAIESIAGKIGCATQTLANWVRQAERSLLSLSCKQPHSKQMRPLLYAVFSTMRASGSVHSFSHF